MMTINKSAMQPSLAVETKREAPTYYKTLV